MGKRGVFRSIEINDLRAESLEKHVFLDFLWITIPGCGYRSRYLVQIPYKQRFADPAPKAFGATRSWIFSPFYAPLMAGMCSRYMVGSTKAVGFSPRFPYRKFQQGDLLETALAGNEKLMLALA